MMKKAFVSIITPAYNSERFIEKTIQSVQSQTYTNWEMLIVDDASTDHTRDIIQRYSEEDPRILYLALDQNSGPAAARNKAMQMAEGEYMAFLDADDLWMPKKLELQIAFMEKNHYAFSCTAYEWIDENGDSLNKIIRTIPKTDYKRLLLDCPVGNSTVMYSVDKMGKFEALNIQKRSDYALWLQMTKKGNYIYGMEEVLGQYRVLKNSVSGNKIKLVKYQWEIYRNVEHLSIAGSLFHIAYYSLIKLFGIK